MVAVRILIADDDRARGRARRALVLGGYDTVPADSGEAALAEARERRPGRRGARHRLPDIDGLEVCRRLRSSGNRVPADAHRLDAVADRIDGLDAGADDYLSSRSTSAS